IMADDEEAVQHPKGESGDGEEVHGYDSFTMIAQKGQPALGGLRVLGRSFHPAGNGGFRHVEAEHPEFAMDARRTPTGIVSDHLKDQFTDLLGDPAATAHWIRHFAEHGPVQFETGSMPARNGVRQDDKECLFPVSPEPASYDPEEFVGGSQPWPRLLALKDGELLAKGEVVEHQTAARPKPAKHDSEPEPKQVKHGNQVIADRLCRLPCEVVDFTAGQDCDEAQYQVVATLEPTRCRSRLRVDHHSHRAPHRLSGGEHAAQQLPRSEWDDFHLVTCSIVSRLARRPTSKVIVPYL